MYRGSFHFLLLLLLLLLSLTSISTGNSTIGKKQTLLRPAQPLHHNALASHLHIIHLVYTHTHIQKDRDIDTGTHANLAMGNGAVDAQCTRISDILHMKLGLARHECMHQCLHSTR